MAVWGSPWSKLRVQRTWVIREPGRIWLEENSCPVPLNSAYLPRMWRAYPRERKNRWEKSSWTSGVGHVKKNRACVNLLGARGRNRRGGWPSLHERVEMRPRCTIIRGRRDRFYIRSSFHSSENLPICWPIGEAYLRSGCSMDSSKMKPWSVLRLMLNHEA